MMLLYAIKKNIPVNWAFVIMHFMLAHDEKYGRMPYARILTKIFKYFNVDIYKELNVKMNSNDCEINIKIINNKMDVPYVSIARTFKYLDEESVEPSQESGVTNQMLMN